MVKESRRRVTLKAKFRIDDRRFRLYYGIFSSDIQNQWIQMVRQVMQHDVTKFEALDAKKLGQWRRRFDNNSGI